MSNWIAAPLALLFFFGFIYFMNNRKKIAEVVKEKVDEIKK